MNYTLVIVGILCAGISVIGMLMQYNLANENGFTIEKIDYYDSEGHNILYRYSIQIGLIIAIAVPPICGMGALALTILGIVDP